MRRTILAGVAVAALGFGHVEHASATSVLGDFNVLVWGDSTHVNTDVEGRYAIGGHANLSNFGVGNQLSNSNGTRDDLIVGGNLNWTNGQIHNGNVVVGGDVNMTGYGVPNGSITYGGSGNFDHGSTAYGTQAGGVSFDFSAAQAEARAYSTFLAGLPGNGSYASSSGVTLTGGATNLNVFDLNTSQLAQANNFGLTLDVPTDSTTIINVSGNNLYWTNFQFFDFDASNVLFNFYEATSLNFTNISIEGSVLAPWAHVNFGNGQFNGQLIANSLNATGEFHHVLFDGDLPPAHVVPTPAAGVAGLSLLFGLAGVRWYRRRTA